MARNCPRRSKPCIHWRSIATLPAPDPGRERQLRYRVVGPLLLESVPDCPLFLLVTGISGHAKAEIGCPRLLSVNAVQENGTWVLPFPIYAKLDTPNLKKAARKSS